jgi:DNA-binding MltR family transcriptional regulator
MQSAPPPGPDFDAVLRLQAELRDESSRGVVLVATAMLEEALRELLLAFLVPNASSTDTLLDGPNSALGTLSSKIDAAYRLGLVSDKFCRDLHLIRKLRNDVAHQAKSFKFEDPASEQRVRALTKSHGLLARSPQWVLKHGQLNLQDQFVEAASWMLFFLAAERERIEPLHVRTKEFGYLASLDHESGLPPGVA